MSLLTMSQRGKYCEMFMGFEREKENKADTEDKGHHRLAIVIPWERRPL
jgi:hypothetical protein